MQSPEKSIPFRSRSDLVLTPAQGGSRSAWSVTVKDPLTLRYFQLGAEEHAILELLDGSRSPSDLVAELRSRFPGCGITVGNVGQFVTQLLRSGLLCATSFGLGRRLADWDDTTRRRARLGRLTSLMSIRFRGIDPEPVLARLQPVTRALCTPFSLALIGGLIVAAILAAMSQLEMIVSRLPDLATIASSVNLPAMLVTFVAIKVLHELGHAMACKHFGGECHEIGFILVAFMPLLYCDVTDAWMNSKKWQRIAVSMAGILVELTLAAVCTFLWLGSTRGPESTMFLNVMLICSVNTVLFNGNPLLRYDGYYVLSDLVGIPNLSAESRTALWSVFDRLVLGVSDDLDFGSRRRFGFLFCYGVASVLYRWMVLLLIILFLHATLTGFGLGVLSVVFAGPALLLAAVVPVTRVVKRARQAAEQGAARPRRSLAGSAVFLTAALLLLVIPWPFYIYVPFVVQPESDSAVFVSVGGRIDDTAEPGSVVQAGDVLARLSNPGLQRALEQHRTEVERLARRLEHLNAQRSSNPVLNARVRPTEDALASARTRLQRLTKQNAALTITSPVDGIVYPPPNSVPPIGPESNVRGWTGSPLDAVNRGALLEEQTLLCYAAPRSLVGAILFVEQKDAELVRGGQTVDFQLVSDPSVRWSGRVERVASTRTTDVRREVVAAALAAPTGQAGPEAYYQARASFATTNWQAPLYAPGTARIRCGSLSVCGRALRVLRRLFAVEL